MVAQAYFYFPAFRQFYYYSSLNNPCPNLQTAVLDLYCNREPVGERARATK